MQETSAEHIGGGTDAIGRAGKSTVFELRQYRLHPGARETLIDLFEREFIESQEETGMNIIGQFRDIDDPDSFVWLRGFADMEVRSEALARFYGGPVWAAHARQANATMVNSDNVLLLRSASAKDRIELAMATRPPVNAKGDEAGVILCTICYLPPRTAEDFSGFFEQQIRPVLEQSGASVMATFMSEHSANNFPRLPVREGETVFVWFSAFASLQDYVGHAGRIAGLEGWDRIVSETRRRAWRPKEVLRLVPAARSLLRGMVRLG